MPTGNFLLCLHVENYMHYNTCMRGNIPSIGAAWHVIAQSILQAAQLGILDQQIFQSSRIGNYDPQSFAAASNRMLHHSSATAVITAACM